MAHVHDVLVECIWGQVQILLLCDSTYMLFCHYIGCIVSKAACASCDMHVTHHKLMLMVVPATQRITTQHTTPHSMPPPQEHCKRQHNTTQHSTFIGGSLQAVASLGRHIFGEVPARAGYFYTKVVCTVCNLVCWLVEVAVGRSMWCNHGLQLVPSTLTQLICWGQYQRDKCIVPFDYLHPLVPSFP